MARHAWPHVVEGSLAPFVLFAVTIRLASLTTALLVALAWSFAAMGRRMVSGRRISGILILSTLTLSARTVFAVVSGNLDLYFVPPLVTTVALAIAFACSVPLGRPLSWRLANDLWPMPPHALTDPSSGRVFRRLCWMWAGVNVSKAVLNIWLLATLPLASYAVAKGIVSFALMGTGLTVSYLWLRRVMRGLPEHVEPVALALG
ncbi:MAG: DUF3159 domain-containing protein [Actinobacteria bacterium]|nr:DUF3159 domain-containing protein [Actinomycetota bacterium]